MSVALLLSTSRIAISAGKAPSSSRGCMTTPRPSTKVTSANSRSGRRKSSPQSNQTLKPKSRALPTPTKRMLSNRSPCNQVKRAAGTNARFALSAVNMPGVWLMASGVCGIKSCGRGAVAKSSVCRPASTIAPSSCIGTVVSCQPK